MWVKGNAVAPKGLPVPFLGSGWQGRASSGLKLKWVTAEPAAGMGLSECFRDQTKCVGASHHLVQPLWVQGGVSSTYGPSEKHCPFPR